VAQLEGNRRDFLKAGVLGAGLVAAAPAAGVLASGGGAKKKSLSILVLGGTGFIGPHMVREALRRGHSVTLFNRGRTNNALFPDLETLKGDRNSNLEALEGRKWDAVIDNSGYVPRHVQNSARLLSSNISHYLFISTVAVYADMTGANPEDAPLASIEDERTEQVTGETYGPLKALCEKKVAEEIGDDRLTIMRPTYICGPGDHTDRFTYWPVRTADGGEMLWPGDPSNTMQIIDVRDLANFVIDSLQSRVMGTYNCVTPVGKYSIANLLEDCQAVTATTVDPVWVDEPFIYRHGVADDGGLPVWFPQTGADARKFAFDESNAVAAGLSTRPVRETIRATLEWWRTLSDERRDGIKAGLSKEREAELIALWKAEAAS
jgi:2'-hydroxyisoflavone reductase